MEMSALGGLAADLLLSNLNNRNTALNSRSQSRLYPAQIMQFCTRHSDIFLENIAIVQGIAV